MTRAAGCLLLIAVLVPDRVEARPAADPEFVQLEVGFQRQFKVGLFTPVDLTLRGGGQAVVGTVMISVPDGDGTEARFLTPREKPIQLLPGSETHVRLYARFGAVRSRLTAEFLSQGEVICQREFNPDGDALDEDCPVALETNHKLFLVAGAGHPLGLEDLTRELSPDAPAEIAVARLDDPQSLPTKWYGYEGVDAVVLCTSRPEVYRTLTAGGPQVQALDQWIRMGGKLVLCVGAEGDQVLHPQMPFARFAPGAFEKMSLLAQTGALETYCDVSQPVPGVELGHELRTARLSGVEGVVEVREKDQPLVIRTARGFGQVMFLALDPDQPPLSHWNGRLSLLQHLLDLPVAGKDNKKAGVAPNRVWNYGVVDLSGQLTNALGRFTDVRVIPFWIVALLIIFYLILIGPADYFFLRKVVRRMELTWITFPLIVVGVSMAAYFAAYEFKGSKVRLNQVDLVDVDAVSGMVRGTTWANLFSPRLDTYNITAQPRLPGDTAASGAQTLVSWWGLPGPAMGGMSYRAAAPIFWQRHYSFTPDLDRLIGLPVQVWSTKALTVRWSASAAAVPRAELVDQGPLLSGHVTNSLSMPLEQCVLVYRNWAYELGDLAPGKTAELGPASHRSPLQAMLLGEKVVRDESNKYVQQRKTYDPSSDNVSDILQAMMFYEASGGLAYTHLQNGYQGFVDCSSLLDTDRAVLVARAPRTQAAAGADILSDAHPLAAAADFRLSFLRFVFPVQRVAEPPDHRSAKK
jgi:hypothetical protein